MVLGFLFCTTYPTFGILVHISKIMFEVVDWWTLWGALPPAHQLLMHCLPIDVHMTYLLNM